eukprot:COSAG06_NODE_1923_length_8061_cov_15.756091_8_plen_168_part_00
MQPAWPELSELSRGSSDGWLVASRARLPALLGPGLAMYLASNRNMKDHPPPGGAATKHSSLLLRLLLLLQLCGLASLCPRVPAGCALPPHALIYPRVYTACLPHGCYPLTHAACVRSGPTAAAGVVSFFRGLGRGGQLLVLALLAVVLVEVRSDQMMSTGASSAASS